MRRGSSHTGLSARHGDFSFSPLGERPHVVFERAGVRTERASKGPGAAWSRRPPITSLHRGRGPPISKLDFCQFASPRVFVFPLKTARRTNKFPSRSASRPLKNRQLSHAGISCLFHLDELICSAKLPGLSCSRANWFELEWCRRGESKPRLTLTGRKLLILRNARNAKRPRFGYAADTRR